MSWVSVGIAAVGAVSSIAGGMSAKDAAEKAGEMQAKMIERTRQENKRRELRDLGKSMGDITARVAASNVLMTGSSQRYKQDYESEFKREMAWRDEKSRMDARTALKTGQAAGDSAMYQGLGSAVGYAAQGYGAYKGV